MLRLCGVLPKSAVHFEEFLRLAVKRLKIVVAERPRRRDTIVMHDFFELAALDDQDVQAGVPQGPGESTAAHTGANDHHICGQHFLIGIDKRALTERWWLSHDHAGTLGWVSNSSASVRLGIAARSPRRVVTRAPKAAA